MRRYGKINEMVFFSLFGQIGEIENVDYRVILVSVLLIVGLFNQRKGSLTKVCEGTPLPFINVDRDNHPTHVTSRKGILPNLRPFLRLFFFLF